MPHQAKVWGRETPSTYQKAKVWKVAAPQMHMTGPNLDDVQRRSQLVGCRQHVQSLDRNAWTLVPWYRIPSMRFCRGKPLNVQTKRR